MSDSAGEGKREGLVGRTWLGCWIAAFAVTAVLFWFPWGGWLERMEGAKAAEAAATLVLKSGMLVMWPLNWLASTVGYAVTGAVGVALMTLGLWRLRHNDKGWRANTMCLSIFYGLVAVVYGISGIHVQAAERALDFAKAPTPSGVFKVIDRMTPTQVQAIRKGLAAGASRKLLFEQVTQTAGVDGPYKNTFFYTPGFYQSMFGNSFMTLFYGEDLGIKSGLVCEKIRQNYLKSAVTDRYQLSVNGVVVSASSGSCRSLFLNKVVLSYRGAFAAPDFSFGVLMSHNENTASASVARSMDLWKMLIALFCVSSFLLPIVHWFWQGLGSGMVLFVSLAEIVWSGLGAKGTSFVLCALSLGGICMIGRGKGQFYGTSILIAVALFVVISTGLISNQSRHVRAVVQTSQAVDALSLQDVHTELSNLGPPDNRAVNFNPSMGDYVRWLAWGGYSDTFLKRDCEELQQLAWDNKAFGERYVLFVENQVSTRQSPVKCSATSSNTVTVAYNTTYAPNGLVATIEASKAR